MLTIHARAHEHINQNSRKIFYTSQNRSVLYLRGALREKFKGRTPLENNARLINSSDITNVHFQTVVRRHRYGERISHNKVDEICLATPANKCKNPSDPLSCQNEEIVRCTIDFKIPWLYYRFLFCLVNQLA